ncbi:DUF6612 family protein [Lentibacillus sediminis]|uniref:DUF6612 family protein n=1 Tax=Lentibacillus sediminis TaxID=1940529 RepID=UPI000C1C2913|nr:DUF6612 family protein [Lentibacillus sediminis]
MKKWLMPVIMLAVVISLSACGDVESTGDLDAEEVYQNAVAAAEEMESAEVIIETTSEIEGGGDTEAPAMTMEAKMESKTTMDPLTMHQTGTTTMTLGEMPIETDVELYMAEDEIYIYNGTSDQWMKPAEGEALMNMAGSMEQDPNKQLSMLEEYTDELELSENEEAIVLNMSVNGDAFKELTQEMMPQELLSGLGEEGSELLENMTIHELNYEIQLDKESYHVTATDVYLDMSMGTESEEVRIKQEVKTENKNINNVEPVEIPQEVKDAAVEA